MTQIALNERGIAAGFALKHDPACNLGDFDASTCTVKLTDIANLIAEQRAFGAETVLAADVSQDDLIKVADVVGRLANELDPKRVSDLVSPDEESALGRVAIAGGWLKKFQTNPKEGLADD